MFQSTKVLAEVQSQFFQQYSPRGMLDPTNASKESVTDGYFYLNFTNEGVYSPQLTAVM